jgi:hypothetical protein
MYRSKAAITNEERNTAVAEQTEKKYEVPCAVQAQVEVANLAIAVAGDAGYVICEADDPEAVACEELPCRVKQAINVYGIAEGIIEAIPTGEEDTVWGLEDACEEPCEGEKKE